MGELCSGTPRGTVSLFIEAYTRYYVVAHQGIAKNPVFNDSVSQEHGNDRLKLNCTGIPNASAQCT
jgi:hypothetical protein